jgi:hypothetical protein
VITSESAFGNSHFRRTRKYVQVDCVRMAVTRAESALVLVPTFQNQTARGWHNNSGCASLGSLLRGDMWISRYQRIRRAWLCDAIQSTAGATVLQEGSFAGDQIGSRRGRRIARRVRYCVGRIGQLGVLAPNERNRSGGEEKLGIGRLEPLLS